MHACYARFARRYSGIISRSLPDMRLKLADYASDSAKALGVFEGTSLRGYCVYFDRETVYAEEVIANDDPCEEMLLRALCREASQTGRKSAGSCRRTPACRTAGAAPQVETTCGRWALWALRTRARYCGQCAVYGIIASK